MHACLTCLVFFLGSVSGKNNFALYGKNVAYDISLIKKAEEEWEISSPGFDIISHSSSS